MHKLALLSKTVCPPDGFRYRHPETGYFSHAWTYDAWIADAQRHLEVNQIPVPPDLAQKMEGQLCMTLPVGWCSYHDERRSVFTDLSWNDVRNGLYTFTKWIAGGLKTVDKKEAERRALICSRCYLNVNMQGCSGCQKEVADAEGALKEKTVHDHALKVCAVCKCFLRLKVHFPISTLDLNSTLQEKYPQFCWLKKEGENFIP